MIDVRIACPHCTKRLKTIEPPAIGERFQCPRCHHLFTVQENDLYPASHADVLVAQPFVPPPLTVPAAPLPALTRPGSPPSSPAAVPESFPEPVSAAKALLTVAAVAALFLAGAVSLAVALASRGEKDGPAPSGTADAGGLPAGEGGSSSYPNQAPAKDDPPKADKPPTKSDQPAQKPPPDSPPKKSPRPPDKPPMLRPKPPVKVAALPPKEQAKVDKAIDRGVQFLKKEQLRSGTWALHHPGGMAALPGLTLLECGVPASDPAVKKAVAFVRKAARSEAQTYNLALMILFLDRLGDRGDRRLIQTLALRLAAGQQPSGGWSYFCPVLNEKETRDLFAYLDKERPQDPRQLFEEDRGDRAMEFFVPRSPGEKPNTTVKGHLGEASPAPDKKSVGTVPAKQGDPATLPFDELPPRKLSRDKLPGRIKNLPVVQPLPRAKDLPRMDITDNSNTQFAILGVWAAGRHGVPMERTLALLVKRFRKSQNEDGSWGYHFSTMGETRGSPAMTGSGLLGLAVGHGLIAGASPSRRPSVKDPAIKKGIEALGEYIGRPLGNPPAGIGKRPARREITLFPINLYFLWSVERVGVLYGLPTIAGKDWYPWGAGLLVDHQDANGGWMCGSYHGSSFQTDTCFALLFLKRANLTHDLSEKLQFLSEVRKSK